MYKSSSSDGRTVLNSSSSDGQSVLKKIKDLWIADIYTYSSTAERHTVSSQQQQTQRETKNNCGRFFFDGCGLASFGISSSSTFFSSRDTGCIPLGETLNNCRSLQQSTKNHRVVNLPQTGKEQTIVGYPVFDIS